MMALISKILKNLKLNQKLKLHHMLVVFIKVGELR